MCTRPISARKRTRIIAASTAVGSRRITTRSWCSRREGPAFHEMKTTGRRPHELYPRPRPSDHYAFRVFATRGTCYSRIEGDRHEIASIVLAVAANAGVDAGARRPAENHEDGRPKVIDDSDTP